MRNRREYHKQYYQDHKEHLQEESRKYHREHKEEAQARNKKWREEHKEEQREYHKKWIRDNKIQYWESVRRNEQRIRKEVLVHYGNGKLACMKCGYSDIRALTIDHIKAIGVRRKALKGITFYRWLRRVGYPLGYQTLCMNCQFVKRYEENECGRQTLD